MTYASIVLTAINTWWDNLRRYKGGMPARGTVAGALVVLDRLKEDYNLDLDSHRTPGRSQIRGVSGATTQQIIERYGETRQFLSEGGRTNRGLAGDIGALLDALRPLNLDKLPSEDQNEMLSELQIFLVAKVREYFSQERLKVTFNPNKTSWDAVHELLIEAQVNDKGGPLAEYLVGAKLTLRFPETEIDNHPSSAADASVDRPGDFTIGDAAFHITVHPSPGHFQRCLDNIRQGLHPYLLVPDRILAGTRQNAALEAPGQITVDSIESFVSQNLNELAEFSSEGIVSGFARLLQAYNQRVDQIKNDKSLLIDIPHNLQTDIS